MTLTAHAITGAAVASLIPSHPVIAFCAAFGSHFLVDAIPHYEYPVHSGSLKPHFGEPLHLDATLVGDLLVIATDGLLGFSISLFVFARFGMEAAVIGAIAGMLPDALQFVYMRFPRQPLVALQRFHQGVHTKNHLQGKPFLGTALQVAFAGLVIFSTHLLR